tara:strand:+ start:497 stop:784 length:288 start_codon:yes stop_codon:yes gene_type:complete
MNKSQIIDCMIDADKRLQEGYGEIKAVGKNYYCEDLLQFLPLTKIPTIINLFQAIKDSDESYIVKVFALEGLASGLSDIATALGFICYKNEMENK